MVSTSVGILFKLELLHRYYSDNACPDFEIQPSAATAAKLQDLQVIVKQFRHLLYAGIPVDADGRPDPVPPSPLQLTFFLQLQNPLFFQYTNLPADLPPGRIFYFSNRNPTAAAGKQFLSAALLPYSGAKSYQVGDLALDVAGNVYRAIRLKEAADPVAFPDPIFWAAVDAARYTSEADVLHWRPSVFTYSFDTPQSTASVQVEGYNAATGDDSTLVLNKTMDFPQPVPSFQLDLSALPPGRYVLTVNSVKTALYLNDELQRRQAFAVVDVFLEAGLPAGKQLLDGAGRLLSPQFSLAFLNRATVWKYIIASGRSGTITDAAGTYQFSGPGSNILSQTPIPLLDRARNFTLHIGPDEYTRIACASPQRLRVLERDGSRYACSEIVLNN